ncbi:MAG: hypothetical protein IJ615_00995 [Bacteroidaceae bacterium]|nr:hypothetical protein [Bacteroidaceae bacterium]
MKKSGLGLVIPKTLRIGGMTLYQRGGQVIGRVSESREKRSNTLAQFIQRQKMRHTTALWKMLRYAEPMFTERANAYQDFASLANGLPPVYVEKTQMTDASFLMPGIPVSNGKLPTIDQHLGEVDGKPALLTNLTIGSHQWGEQLWLYTAEQRQIEAFPRVWFSHRVVTRQEMTIVDGRLAIVCDEFADLMKGWALVRIVGDRCSPQTIQTRCTLYQQYTTDEALQRAAKSYGGITDQPFMSPK